MRRLAFHSVNVGLGVTSYGLANLVPGFTTSIWQLDGNRIGVLNQRGATATSIEGSNRWLQIFDADSLVPLGPAVNIGATLVSLMGLAPSVVITIYSSSQFPIRHIPGGHTATGVCDTGTATFGGNVDGTGFPGGVRYFKIDMSTNIPIVTVETPSSALKSAWDNMGPVSYSSGVPQGYVAYSATDGHVDVIYPGGGWITGHHLTPVSPTRGVAAGGFLSLLQPGYGFFRIGHIGYWVIDLDTFAPLSFHPSPGTPIGATLPVDGYDWLDAHPGTGNEWHSAGTVRLGSGKVISYLSGRSGYTPDLTSHPLRTETFDSISGTIGPMLEAPPETGDYFGYDNPFLDPIRDNGPLSNPIYIQDTFRSRFIPVSTSGAWSIANARSYLGPTTVVGSPPRTAVPLSESRNAVLKWSHLTITDAPAWSLSSPFASTPVDDFCDWPDADYVVAPRWGGGAFTDKVGGIAARSSSEFYLAWYSPVNDLTNLDPYGNPLAVDSWKFCLARFSAAAATRPWAGTRIVNSTGRKARLRIAVARELPGLIPATVPGMEGGHGSSWLSNPLKHTGILVTGKLSGRGSPSLLVTRGLPRPETMAFGDDYYTGNPEFALDRPYAPIFEESYNSARNSWVGREPYAEGNDIYDEPYGFARYLWREGRMNGKTQGQPLFNPGDQLEMGFRLYNTTTFISSTLDITNPRHARVIEVGPDEAGNPQWTVAWAGSGDGLQFRLPKFYQYPFGSYEQGYDNDRDAEFYHDKWLVSFVPAESTGTKLRQSHQRDDLRQGQGVNSAAKTIRQGTGNNYF